MHFVWLWSVFSMLYPTNAVFFFWSTTERSKQTKIFIMKIHFKHTATAHTHTTRMPFASNEIRMRNTIKNISPFELAADNHSTTQHRHEKKRREVKLLNCAVITPLSCLFVCDEAENGIILHEQNDAERGQSKYRKVCFFFAAAIWPRIIDKLLCVWPIRI